MNRNLMNKHKVKLIVKDLKKIPHELVWELIEAILDQRQPSDPVVKALQRFLTISNHPLRQTDATERPASRLPRRKNSYANRIPNANMQVR